MIKHLLTSVVLLHDTTHVHGLDEPSMFECVCTSVCESVCVCVCLCVCVEEHAPHLHLPRWLQHLNPRTSYINCHLHHLQKVGH